MRAAAVDVLAAVSVLMAAASYRRWDGLRQEVLLVRREELNVTGLADQEGLVFNRVPKVGSETIWTLIDRLARVNGFNSFSDSMSAKNDRGGENTFLGSSFEREAYANILQRNCTKPYSYVKHLNFLNLEEFGLRNPIYVNFVRDPVERVISWYYYHRAPWHLLKVDKATNNTQLQDPQPSVSSLKTSFDACYRQRQSECTYEAGQSVFYGTQGGSHVSQIAFYCGHELVCDRFENREALAMAKRNVDRYYAVVGVLEQMDRSLQVLESYVPRYFKSAREEFKVVSKRFHQNKNIFKPKTDPWIKRDMRKHFTLEIEFYEYCKQRLNKQYLSII